MPPLIARLLVEVAIVILIDDEALTETAPSITPITV